MTDERITATTCPKCKSGDLEINDFDELDGEGNMRNLLSVRCRQCGHSLDDEEMFYPA